MDVRARRYDPKADFDSIGRFLVQTYNRKCRGHVNWVQPRWEYMHFHPQVRDVDLSAAGIWETDGEIVAVAHPELRVGTAYFELSTEHPGLKAAMLTYAQEHLAVAAENGRRLRILVNDQDSEFQELAQTKGFRWDEFSESMSLLAIPRPLPRVPVPDGFRLKSLAEDNDLGNLHRLIWRGFNHGPEPPDDGLAERRLMQSAPNFRKDLNVVVEAPDGRFVSYCGMWLEPVHRIAYVEPVATDPDFRRMGLGSAAVREGIRRCGEAGATLACVGTSMAFYQSLGFRAAYSASAWIREWE